MSLFGEALPFEDDTATSLIRRVGFPPDKMYAQMPEIYLCPCCSEFSKQEERERLLREARDAKEAERRRLMQLDVFEERARPLPSGDVRRKAYRRIMEDDELAETAPSVPPPPQTIDDLRRAKKDQKVPKLIVTVHCGRHVSAEHDDRISVIVRCGAFEGQTEKVLRGKEVMVAWEELFEFPYINHNEPLEVLVVNDALPEKNDQLIGGVVIPCSALHDRSLGDQEPLPIMPEDSMQTGYGSCQEGPLGTIVASWYLRGVDDKMDEEAIEQQTLSVPLGCTFVVHHLFQFTDYGAEAYTGGVLCVLRDTDDNCSESVLYKPGTQPEPSLSPYYGKDGYYYLPGNPSQVMQLNTERKLGHILVCVPKKEESSSEEEELLVIGAVPLEFERLYHKGNAVLLIESKSKEDALWGEIEVEWVNKPLDDLDLHPSSLEVQKESLFFTVVRGLNLVRRDGDPVAEAYVSVASGELEGATVEAPATMGSDGNTIISWNQEVRFVEVDPAEKVVEVQVYEKDRLVSVGQCTLEDDEEGVIIVQMYHAASINEEAGEVVGSYKRLHAPRPVEEDIYRKRRAAEEATYRGADEEDEEQEEVHRAAELDESNMHEDEEEEEEEEEPQATRATPMADRAMSISDDFSEEKEVDEAAPYETPQRQRSEREEQRPEEDEEEAQREPEMEDELQPEEAEDAEHLVEEALEEVSEPEEGEEGLRQPAEVSEEASEAASESEERDEGLRQPAEVSEEASEAASESEEGDEGLRQPAEVSEEASEAASESEKGDEGLRQPAEVSEEASEAASESEEGDEGLRQPAEVSEEASEAASEPEDGEEGLRQPAEVSEAASEPEEGEEGLRQPAELEEAPEAASEPEEGEEGLGQPAEVSEEVWQPEEEQPEEEEYHGELHRQEYELEEAHQTEVGEFEAEHYHAAARSAGTPTAEAEAAAAYHAIAGGRHRRRPSWASSGTKSSGYKQPWYPSGAPETDQHIPFSKTKLSKKNLESIRQLETCKSRIEEESVRRSSTPRRSSTRGLSPSSQ